MIELEPHARWYLSEELLQILRKETGCFSEITHYKHFGIRARFAWSVNFDNSTMILSVSSEEFVSQVKIQSIDLIRAVLERLSQEPEKVIKAVFEAKNEVLEHEKIDIPCKFVPMYKDIQICIYCGKMIDKNQE